VVVVVMMMMEGTLHPVSVVDNSTAQYSKTTYFLASSSLFKSL